MSRNSEGCSFDWRDERIAELELELEQQRKRFEILWEEYTHDRLTGLLTRRYGWDCFKYHLKSLRKRVLPSVGYLLIDLDHFKEVNDTYGHPAGDQVLRRFGKIIKTNCRLRKTDLMIRWGGEEFLIVLPGADAEEVARVAERVRQAVERATFILNDLEGTRRRIKKTASVGVAATRTYADVKSAVALADLALYEAKQGGRNCVRIAQTDA